MQPNMIPTELHLPLWTAVPMSILAAVCLFLRFLPTDAAPNRSYNELATQLSQVAGKSEVVINAIADGMLALDGKGVIQLINPAAGRIIGWNKQDAVGLDYKSVLKLIDSKNQPLDSMNDPIVSGIANNIEVRSDLFSIRTSSDKTLLTSIVVSPIGQPGEGVIVVFRDITNEKKEERQQAEFISTASHEMRTPVASIEGYLGLALNPNTAQIDDKAREFITKAHDAATHLGRLFQDLLDVSKADDGRLNNNPKVVDVVQFIHDIAEGFRDKAAQKNLRLFYKPIPDDDQPYDKKKLQARNLSPVMYTNVDNDHLREIMANLIENAIKYTPSGDVVIDVTGNDTHVTISVADTGIGIPIEDQSHLFQKFYRIDNSDTREIGGTGLGLYLCRRLAEAMNGRIWVESEHKKGSTFYLELPRVGHEDAMRLIEQSVQAETTIQPTSPELPPAPLPEAPPQPQPTPPSPTDAAPVESSVTPPPMPTVTRPNTPISAIEADPSRYAPQTRQPTITVPDRTDQA